ncbi:hypothetical protein RRG08_048065 [Elysia crispata]|uniref:Uncharacterized protein n=1 Tax=Elysia crispata TaxID=231223 RepID=A0AAE1D8Y0_9GAST|nr:hypothetical protein RRG08_048065 [Elysia crispata]
MLPSHMFWFNFPGTAQQQVWRPGQPCDIWVKALTGLEPQGCGVAESIINDHHKIHHFTAHTSLKSGGHDHYKKHHFTTHTSLKSVGHDHNKTHRLTIHCLHVAQASPVVIQGTLSQRITTRGKSCCHPRNSFTAYHYPRQVLLSSKELFHSVSLPEASPVVIQGTLSQRITTLDKSCCHPRNSFTAYHYPRQVLLSSKELFHSVSLPETSPVVIQGTLSQRITTRDKSCCHPRNSFTAYHYPRQVLLSSKEFVHSVSTCSRCSAIASFAH